MRGTPSIGAREWGQLARGVPPLRLHMLADLVKWAKLDKEIGAKLDLEDAEWVEQKSGLSRLFDTCAR